MFPFPSSIARSLHYKSLQSYYLSFSKLVPSKDSEGAGPRIEGATGDDVFRRVRRPWNAKLIECEVGRAGDGDQPFALVRTSKGTIIRPPSMLINRVGVRNVYPGYAAIHLRVTTAPKECNVFQGSSLAKGGDRPSVPMDVFKYVSRPSFRGMSSKQGEDQGFVSGHVLPSPSKYDRQLVGVMDHVQATKS